MWKEIFAPFFYKPRTLDIPMLSPEFFAALDAAASGIQGPTSKVIRPPAAVLTPRVGKLLATKSTTGTDERRKINLKDFVI